MRCPNPACRVVFTVLDVPEGRTPRTEANRPSRSDPPPSTGIRLGTVGDLVPILPAETVTPEPVEEGFEILEPIEPVNEAPSWKQPPPVRRPPGKPPRPAAPIPERRPKPAKPPVAEPEVVAEPVVVPEPILAAEPPTPVEEVPPLVEAPPPAPQPPQPVELPPGAWEPPPVRRGESVKEPELATADTHEEFHPDEPKPLVRGRWTARVILTLSVVVLIVLGSGIYFVWRATRQTEESLANQARESYDAGRFSVAADKFKQLQDLFPSSERLADYSFYEELSGIRASLGEPRAPVADGLKRIEEFLKAHKGEPLLRQTAPDLARTLAKLLEELPSQIRPQIDDSALAVVAHARQVRDLLKQDFKEAISPELEGRMEQVFNQVNQAVSNWQHRRAVLAYLDELAQHPSAQAVTEALRLIQREPPDFEKDPEVSARKEKLYAGHRASITYTRSDEELAKPNRPEDAVPMVLFDLPVPGAPIPRTEEEGITLALVRGVLYAQDRGTGAVRWAMRVGIDTTTLPVRVPATGSSRERILVLSSDAATLTALDSDGNQLWTYRLSSPCLGRPVIVDQLAYLPTYDGQVHEIELILGRLVGRYQLGQRLTVGGARQPGTKRLYFPADDSCVYVLNVGEHRCEAILYSGHPAGSLRGEPLVVAPTIAGIDTPAYLILNQTAGLDAMQLRVFELPIPERGEPPVRLATEPRVQGWTWFPPAQDGEKLVLLSDEGKLGLFGIRQARNLDQALFPWLPNSGPGGISLDPFLKPRTQARGRSQVVQAQGDDFWLLAHGKLTRLGLRWQQREGPKLVQEWDQPLELGSPLHASQVEQDRRTGRSTLFLVTQHLTQQTCLSTAVDDETGQIRWQRQLGLVCQREPLAVNVPGGPPLLLMLDEGGGLFVLDPLKFREGAGSDWQSGGRLLARALDVNPNMAPLLLPTGDGQSAYEIACPGEEGRQLVVRHITVPEGERQPKTTERTVPLTAPLAGTPTLVGNWLVLPLASGDLARLPLPLPENARLELGEDWRSRQAGPEARCYLVALDQDRFLSTDGARGLIVWRWTDQGLRSQPPEAERPTLTLADRVVAAPLVLPTNAAAGTSRICVADSANNVTLLDVLGNGRIEKTNRVWSLGGKITAGPYLAAVGEEGVRIGCVVEGRQLVWLDPTSTDPLWRYDTGGPAIVGEPQRLGDILVVADQGGHYVVLDPRTGQKQGPGHTLQGSIAPAASPVTFGPNRAFAPLSDGTALLLPLPRLSGKTE